MPKVFLRIKKQIGFSLIEVLIAIAVFGLIITAIIGAVIYGRESTMLAGARSRASFFANEGLEATRNIRDANFSNLTDGTWAISTSGNIFSLVNPISFPDVNGIFTRTIIISTIDANTKMVVSQVNWQQNPQRTGQIVLTTYLSNWRQAVTPTPSWANPGIAATLDLPGNHDAYKVKSQGDYSFVVRNNGNPSFNSIGITNADAPSVVGTQNVAGALFNLAVSGNYAYAASGNNSTELYIINITNPASTTTTGTYNAAGNADARGVYFASPRVYLTRNFSADPEFFIINATNPASPTLDGSLNLPGTGYEVVVMGNYAYVANSADNGELQVVNVTNPAAPTIAGTLDLPGAEDGLSIEGFGTTVVLGRIGGQVAIINVANPAAPALVSTYNSGAGNVEDLSLGNSNNYLFLVKSGGANQFQVVNIATLVSPALFGQLTVNPLLGVDYHSAKDRAFVVGADNNPEFRTLKPQ